MNTNNSAFAIRTHKFSEQEKVLYEYAVKYFGASNTFIACNTTKNNVNIPDQYNNITFNEGKILNDSGLFWHSNWSWACGDYWYYALYNSLENYEYIWLCEPDVYFCNKDSGDFFKQFESINADFLSFGYGTAGNNLHFFHTSKVLEGTPMSCLFGITRIKKTLLKTLFEKRVQLSLSFLNKKYKPNQYPNDEIFFSTTIKMLNYSIAKMEDLTSFDSRLFTADEDQAMTLEDSREIKGNFIIHPVLEEDVFLQKKINRLSAKLNDNASVSEWMRKILLKTKNKRLKKELRNQFIKVFNNYIEKL
jgi:hypothetical protein